MLNKIYEKIKVFIKENYKSILGLILLTFLCFYELPFVIYTPGGIVPLESRIKIDDEYKSNGSINMSYVSMVKGKIPLVLLSFIIPNWDLVSKDSVTMDNGSIDDLIKLEHLYMKSSVDNATIVAYKKAYKYLNITNKVNNIIYISELSNTDLKLYDQIIKADDIEIDDINTLKEIVKNHKEGDKIKILVKRDNKEIECYAKVFLKDDELLIGIAFLTTYEYTTDPTISVKTKSSESGSSGGLMLSLAIYNKLTPNDITNNKKVVGTGTIDIFGNVGKIDGIKYKLLGASKKKADIFLCPIDNYDEAIKVKDEYKLNINIEAVSTFDEALSKLN